MLGAPFARELHALSVLARPAVRCAVALIRSLSLPLTALSVFLLSRLLVCVLACLRVWLAVFASLLCPYVARVLCSVSRCLGDRLRVVCVVTPADLR